MIPAIMPATTTMKALNPASAPRVIVASGYVNTAISTPASIVENVSGLDGSPPSLTRTKNEVIIAENTPAAATAMGSKAQSTHLEPAVARIAVAAMIIAEIMDSTYDSNRSAPIPATSPTLSPTLSAITPGFLGSSSGIPSSTLPTRSAPMSAALV